MSYPALLELGWLTEHLQQVGETSEEGTTCGDYAPEKAATAPPDDRATAASRSHREAERRRRLRINNHLNTLRMMVPNMPKTDKASLLAEVVNQVKQLSQHAAHVAAVDVCAGIDPESEAMRTGVCRALLLPGEVDEVTLEPDAAASTLRATVTCQDRHGLLFELAAALRNLGLKVVKAEMATLGGRIKGVLSIRAEVDDDQVEVEAALVRRVLRSVLEKKFDSAAVAAAGGRTSHKRPRLVTHLHRSTLE